MDNATYIILNLCRVLAYVQDGLVLSKKEGGEWGLKNIHRKYQGLIKEALVCYTSDQNMIPNASLAVEYCKYMKNNIGL
ncbi:aminoglycoside adenylyltransferase domain-containing protein [Clostridium sp. JN-9]|uniref:aminoglycoside adenylyltransferase domain-containing protein n=1 Tax=Clostridium sp. JN-9 TaxID=2507159 RepID=UPI00242C0EEA|nr:aminoglycoside adenylyltransferase domain-containing protein [Clostridium sp. JN-9]